MSKTPVPDLSVPGEGPALDPDTQAFLDAHGGHGFAGAEGMSPTGRVLRDGM